MIYNDSMYMYIYIYRKGDSNHYIPVVPHKAVADFKNRKRIGEIDCCE